LDKKEINNRRASAAETKKKIYESAEWLFHKYGFANVSVDSIVERAGVAKGSFYVHFKSKYSLIATFLSDYITYLDLDYRSYYESFSADSKACDVLLAFVGKIIDIIVNNIGYETMRFLYEVQIAKTVDTNILLDYNRDLYTVFILIINKGVRQEEFKATIPVDRIVKHFVYRIRGYVNEWCVRYPDFDLKKEVLEEFQILLEGIKYPTR
jgi:AcrR family transcriptional regulator